MVIWLYQDQWFSDAVYVTTCSLPSLVQSDALLVKFLYYDHVESSVGKEFDAGDSDIEKAFSIRHPDRRFSVTSLGLLA